MASVRGKDTKPEILLRSVLHRRGFRFRKNLKGVPGTPDIAFTRAKLAVFVDGDFWHGRELEQDLLRNRLSKNREFWVNKLRRNSERDREIDRHLTSLGWKVLRFWESDVEAHLIEIADRIAVELSASMSESRN